MAISHVQFKSFTEDDYYRLGENVRAELIDGKFYYMASPSRLHQEILSALHAAIHSTFIPKRVLARCTLLRSQSSSLMTPGPLWSRISVSSAIRTS